MEYVRSRSLHQVVETDGPLPPERVAEIGLKVLDALVAAHRAGVLHRDVKPHNVLIADDGRVVLTDFGLATFDGDSAVTRQGMVMGSPQYVSPERARDGASTPEADMWSLGATLYAAVEGRSPFARPTTLATLTALATSPPDPPQRAGALRPVLSGLLRKEPRQRFTAPRSTGSCTACSTPTSRCGPACSPGPAGRWTAAIARRPAARRRADRRARRRRQATLGRLRAVPAAPALSAPAVPAAAAPPSSPPSPSCWPPRSAPRGRSAATTGASSRRPAPARPTAGATHRDHAVRHRRGRRGRAAALRRNGEAGHRHRDARTGTGRRASATCCRPGRGGRTRPEGSASPRR